MANSKEIISRWLYGLCEILVLFPIILSLTIIFIPLALLPYWFAGLALLMLAGVSVRLLSGVQKRWVYLVFSLILSLTLAAFYQDMLAFTLTALFGFVVAFRGVFYGERSGERYISLAFLWSGFIIYFFAYFFYRFIDTFTPYLGVISWAGALLIVLTLFLTNSFHLKAATLSQEKRPFMNRSVKRQNRFFLILMLVVTVVILNYQMLEQLYERGISLLASVFAFLFAERGHEGPILEEVPLPIEDAPALPEEEPSMFFQLLEQIIIYIAYALLACAVLFLIFLAIKKMRKRMKQLWRWLMAFLTRVLRPVSNADTTSPYIDEKESVFEWRRKKYDYRGRLKHWLKNPWKRKLRFEDFPTGREQVRFLYRSLLKQEMKDGYRFKRFRTPSEHLAKVETKRGEDGKLLQLLGLHYGKARYSKQDIDSTKVTQIYSDLKRSEKN